MYRPRQGGHAVASPKPYALAARTEVAQTCPALRPQVKMLKEQHQLSATVQRCSASDIGPLCDAMQSGMIGLGEPRQCAPVTHSSPMHRPDIAGPLRPSTNRAPAVWPHAFAVRRVEQGKKLSPPQVFQNVDSKNWPAVTRAHTPRQARLTPACVRACVSRRPDGVWLGRPGDHPLLFRPHDAAEPGMQVTH